MSSTVSPGEERHLHGAIVEGPVCLQTRSGAADVPGGLSPDGGRLAGAELPAAQGGGPRHLARTARSAGTTSAGMSVAWNQRRRTMFLDERQEAHRRFALQQAVPSPSILP